MPLEGNLNRKTRLFVADASDAPSDQTPEGHCPRWRYDCGRCKFSWNCGPLCACALGNPFSLAPTPPKRQREVDAALLAAGYEPHFRNLTLKRLRDPEPAR